MIAVVEDDPHIRALVSGLLSREGFEAVACSHARDFDRLMEQRRVDLVVLDLMLPGEDGLSICRRLRNGPSDTPVLMVTAKGDDVDRIVGLEIGADDYVAKPFEPRELVLRIGNILKRTAPPPVEALEQVAFGPYVYHLDRGYERLEEKLSACGADIERLKG